MTVNELATKGNFKVLSLPEPKREITGAYVGDLLSWVMGRASSGDAWITIMTNINVLAVATLADVACIILAENVEIANDVVSTAIVKNVNILISEKSTYETSVILSKLI